MQRPVTPLQLSVRPEVTQQDGMAHDVHATSASPPSPTETDSDASSTVRDVTPGPSHTIGTSTPADAAAINQDTQNIVGQHDEAEKRPKSGKPFSSFTQNQKWGIVVMSSIAGLFSPISSVILAPSLPILVEQFQRSSEDINLTMTLYLVFQGLTPSFWGSLSDSIGRRPVYIVTLSIYVGACIGLALTPTSAYWLLLVMRMVQATGGSAVIAIGSGCVSDIATPGERGKYMGLFSALSMAGPAIGPVLGGILSYALSWRWIFWILAIGCGVSLGTIIFFLPETLRSIVGDGSLPKPWYNMRPQESFKLREEAKNRFGKGILPPPGAVEKLQRKKFKPFESFRMLFYPDVILMLLYSSLIYAEYYCVLTVYSQLLKKNYGYNDIQIGLCYVSNGVGAMAMAFGIGRFLDWDFKRAKKALGFNPTEAISLDGFPIEKTRLRAFPYVVSIYLVSCIGFGWALQSRTHIAVSVILNFFIGGGLQITMGITSVLLVDLFPGTGGAITASFNLTRCLIGAGATAVIDPVIAAIGEGWAFTLFSGIILLLAPMPIILVKKGPAWRKARVDAMKVKADAKDAHRKEKANR